jgi:hypothetical protein
MRPGALEKRGNRMNYTVEIRTLNFLFHESLSRLGSSTAAAPRQGEIASAWNRYPARETDTTHL